MNIINLKIKDYIVHIKDDLLNWKKLGQIFKFEKVNKYLISHASNPLAIHLHNNIFRIFYSGRNIDNQSSIGFVDIDFSNYKKINSCKKAIFKISNACGGFFSDGISIGNVYECNGKSFMLFMAWRKPKGEHWKGLIGRLVLSKNKSSLHLIDHRPFLSTDQEDKISLSYPWVIFDQGIYKMWYGSTISWESKNGEMIHVINYATSNDGEKWQKHGIAIPYELNIAQAFSRPTVIKDRMIYHMWFSYRSGTGQKYRIGYASSSDGINWARKQESGIDISKSGWDSEMICYPCVFEHKGERYMLYNGNDYGKTGFGLAIST